MITDVCQRWRQRKSTYRPAGELARINPLEFEVAAIDGAGSDTLVKAFVEAHHYSGSMPAAKQRVGLYRRSEMEANLGKPLHLTTRRKAVDIALRLAA